MPDTENYLDKVIENGVEYTFRDNRVDTLKEEVIAELGPAWLTAPTFLFIVDMQDFSFFGSYVIPDKQAFFNTLSETGYEIGSNSSLTHEQALALTKSCLVDRSVAESGMISFDELSSIYYIGADCSGESPVFGGLFEVVLKNTTLHDVFNSKFTFRPSDLGPYELDPEDDPADRNTDKCFLEVRSVGLVLSGPRFMHIIKANPNFGAPLIFSLPVLQDFGEYQDDHITIISGDGDVWNLQDGIKRRVLLSGAGPYWVSWGQSFEAGAGHLLFEAATEDSEAESSTNNLPTPDFYVWVPLKDLESVESGKINWHMLSEETLRSRRSRIFDPDDESFFLESSSPQMPSSNPIGKVIDFILSDDPIFAFSKGLKSPQHQLARVVSRESTDHWCLVPLDDNGNPLPEILFTMCRYNSENQLTIETSHIFIDSGCLKFNLSDSLYVSGRFFDHHFETPDK